MPPRKKGTGHLENIAVQPSLMINEQYNRHTFFILMVLRIKNIVIIIHVVYISMTYGVRKEITR